ncbi:succinyl-diaminopimelate desuccinylase [Pseudoalteromonas piscicida]|uniref:succinyl-diaminopimelate desuccinylase n=1 Tax=Pseudoalteromonas piscicida TaxID=43662 RepID=UPI001D09ADA9|nr:succinyl-diaminopimelate desuccinylase [Pseudoalteromonas piscicida]UDM61567.1 succinyl-diaminopimelate desuccinylase [Pseudoalteromonas piscicida]
MNDFSSSTCFELVSEALEDIEALHDELQGIDEDKHTSHRVVDIARQLVAFKSITPDDVGCQLWLAQELRALGFSIKHLPVRDVSNLVASIGNNSDARFAFLGHTDVVPAGSAQDWQFNPFKLTEHNGCLFARGIVDMKGAIAAFFCAIEALVTEFGIPEKELWLLLTSDEEGEAEHGTKRITQFLKQQRITFDFTLVGEPSSEAQVADTLKVGRRGALSFTINLHGKTGHVAYPQKATNVIHLAQNIMQALLSMDWPKHCDNFDSTTLQFTHVNSGDFVDNIIPSQCQLNFNIRYTPAYNEYELVKLVRETIEKHTLNYALTTNNSCKPYYCVNNDEIPSPSLAIVCDEINSQCHFTPKLSTAGGTSDGRFIAEISTSVLELGLVNKTIHQIDEHTTTSDLIQLQQLYYGIYKRLLYPTLHVHSTTQDELLQLR